MTVWLSAAVRNASIRTAQPCVTFCCASSSSHESSRRGEHGHEELDAAEGMDEEEEEEEDARGLREGEWLEAGRGHRSTERGNARASAATGRMSLSTLTMRNAWFWKAAMRSSGERNALAIASKGSADARSKKNQPRK